MKMQHLIIVGDSDALISIFHKDANHEVTKELLKKLSNQDAEIIFPAAILAEAITTTMQQRFRENNPHLAQLLVQQLTSDLITTVPTDEEILQLAASLFNPQGSKEHTFFDAIVAATTKKYQAHAIFSFDQWYKKQGYILVGDFDI
jgi:predicted nucleic acid-binding protein